MIRIVEKIVEPSKIVTGSFFRLKIKIDDDYLHKKTFVTENGLNIITENGNRIRTEMGE